MEMKLCNHTEPFRIEYRGTEGRKMQVAGGAHSLGDGGYE